MKAIASYTTTMITIIVLLVAGPTWAGAISPEADSLELVSPASSSAARALHIGMSKRFHLRDGNAVTGKIVDIDGVNVCTIETLDGTLRIPAMAILEETVEVVKKDDTGYDGPVLKEDSQEVVVRSAYGDVVVSKEDIREMHRYYGGKRISWAEEKKRFYQGEATLTGTFTDPTAFLLRPHTFYISGLSLGYGFSERFNVFTNIGPDFNGDLNVKLRYAVFQRAQGASETALAVGLGLFRDHRMISRYRQYSHWLGRGRDGVIVSDDQRFDEISPDAMEIEDVLEDPDARQFDWTFHTVLSHRQPLGSGRGKWGWHLGFSTNGMAFDKPALKDSSFTWDSDFRFPYRVWVAADYDLSKRLKLIGRLWADNGYKYLSFGKAMDDYLGDVGEPFTFDSPSGRYRPVDMDFGVLMAVSETLRLGMHFQKPFITLYWEFYEL